MSYNLIPARLLPPDTSIDPSHPPRNGWCENQLPPYLDINSGVVGGWTVTLKSMHAKWHKGGHNRHLSATVLLNPADGIRQIGPRCKSRQRNVLTYRCILFRCRLDSGADPPPIQVSPHIHVYSIDMRYASPTTNISA